MVVGVRWASEDLVQGAHFSVERIELTFVIPYVKGNLLDEL